MGLKGYFTKHRKHKMKIKKTEIKTRYCKQCGKDFAAKGFATHKKWCKGNLNQAMPVPDYGDKGKHVFPVELQTNALPKRSLKKLDAYLLLIGIMASKSVIENLEIEPMISAVVWKMNNYIAETE